MERYKIYIVLYCTTVSLTVFTWRNEVQC